MNEKYFIDDYIPRYLCKYIEENYNIWIVVREQEDTFRWNSEIVPDYVRENVVLLRDFDISDLVTLADQEDSVVITNYPENKSLYNICGPVYEVKSFFELTFHKITFADFLFCFGFTEEQFYNFCEESNLIGVVKNETIRDKDENNKTNGMAFWVEPNKTWKEQVEDFTSFANICIDKRLFVPKHHRTLLSVLYQGKNEKTAIDSNLPILYI